MELTAWRGFAVLIILISLGTHAGAEPFAVSILPSRQLPAFTVANGENLSSNSTALHAIAAGNVVAR